jgi:hypothetical protein
MAFEVRRLTKRYGGVAVLEDVVVTRDHAG